MDNVFLSNPEELENILTGANEREPNPVESLINIFTSPIAKRKGVVITKEDCVIWAEELKSFLNKDKPLMHVKDNFVNDADFHEQDSNVERFMKDIRNLK